MLHFNNSNSLYTFFTGAVVSNLSLPVNITDGSVLLLLFVGKAAVGGLIAQLTADFYKKIKKPNITNSSDTNTDSEDSTNE